MNLRGGAEIRSVFGNFSGFFYKNLKKKSASNLTNVVFSVRSVAHSPSPSSPLSPAYTRTTRSSRVGPAKVSGVFSLKILFFRRNDNIVK